MLHAGCIYLAFDVGGTNGTGIVGVEYTGSGQFRIVWAEDVKLDSIYESVKSALAVYKERPGCIIIEDFLLYPKKAQSLYFNKFDPVGVKWVIKTYAYEMGLLDHIVYQRACDIHGKGREVAILPEHVPDLRGLTHAKDAYRHIRRYFVKEANK